MTKQTSPRKRRYCILCIISMVLLILSLLVGCGSDKEDSSADSTYAGLEKTVDNGISSDLENTNENGPAAAESVDESVKESAKASNDVPEVVGITEKETTGISVPAPVGDLSFPLQENENITMEDVSADGRTAYRFFGEIQGEKVLLFEIIFGAGGTGYRIGSAPDSTGTQQELWLNIQEIEPRSSWTESEISEINREQELVNDLLEQIYSLPGYIRDE